MDNLGLNYVPSHDPNFGRQDKCIPIMEGFSGSTNNLLRIIILFLIIALVYNLV